MQFTDRRHQKTTDRRQVFGQRTAYRQKLLGRSSSDPRHSLLYLVDKFCATYDPATAENFYGVPIVDEYSPSADNTKYPSRATLAATYSFIKDDIKQAKENMIATGQHSFEYLSTDALTAFEARIALLTKDYDTAIRLRGRTYKRRPVSAYQQCSPDARNVA